MNRVAGEETADYVYTARRNNSLSSSERQLVFGFILIVSLSIAAAISIAFGAWPVMPFAGLEMAVLYVAFRYIERHAGDYERITIRGNSVAVEVREGSRLSHFELQRWWAQVVCDVAGARLALRSHGREIQIGRHLSEAQRVEMARDLSRELRRVRYL